MHAWEQIQQSIDFIEDHLDEEVNITKLSKMASLSPYYYQRLFHRLVKKPVGEYVKLRKMARATKILLQKDKRILEIAMDLGFTTHEQFSRTFKDTFGLTPDEYRKNPQTLNCMTKPQLLLHYTLVDEGVPLITDHIILEISRKEITQPIHYIGIKKEIEIQYLSGLGTESGIDPLDSLWRSFHILKETSLGLTANGEEVGVAYPSIEEGYFSYFAGAISSKKEVPEGYMEWELPPGEYVVCTFEAEKFEDLVMDALYKAQRYLYNIWLPKYKLQTDMFCAERYASYSPETTSMEIWLKLIE